MDCDLASYRIKWSSEVEQYFAAKQQAASSIIRKTTPVDEDDIDGAVIGLKGAGITKGNTTGTLKGLFGKTRI